MKVLVTGGAGYIGSITVERLIDHGASVIVYDNLYQGHAAAVHPEATFVCGDLADRAAVNEVMARHKPDGIMHFASYTLVGESWEKPFLYLRDNIVNGLNLMESAVDARRAAFHPVFDGQPVRPESVAHRRDGADRARQPLRRVQVRPGAHALHWLDRIHGLRYAGSALL